MCTTAVAQSTEDQGIVRLARTYKNMMFGSDPSAEVLADLKAQCPAELATAHAFIEQTITPMNDLLQTNYLKIPDEHVLWQLYTIRMLSQDMREAERIGDQPFIDGLRNTPPARPVQVASYYSMLFIGVGNKNRPFNLSKLDLKPDSYGLLDDAERAIVFLECMDLCRSNIWGYINVVKPPNTKAAMKNIKLFPKVNGAAYYEFKDLAFPDFEYMYDDSLQSYKAINVGQYMELLFYHYVVLQEEGAREEAINALLLGSVMHDESLYKYTKYRSRYESLFKKQKTDR
jgi:hypothetical protein